MLSKCLYNRGNTTPLYQSRVSICCFCVAAHNFADLAQNLKNYRLKMEDSCVLNFSLCACFSNCIRTFGFFCVYFILKTVSPKKPEHARKSTL